MKKAIWKSLVVVMTSVFLFSCSKSTTTVVAPLSATTVKDLPADTIIGITPQGQPFGTGKFTFYSLEKNTIIANSDSATTKWDLAFNGTKILTNSGNSGSGLGGAFIQIGLFEELKTISSDSVFKTDNGPSSYGVTFGSGRGWYTYDPIKNLVTPLAGRVLVI
ncbi:MAG: HmuY family protein, partial [Chitinophagaceae bacterium]